MDRNLRIAIVVGSMAMQGICIGKMMHSAFRLEDQANYLIDILRRNEVPLTEFDMIALKNLKLLAKDA